jgi:hypothetical protein
MFAGQPMVQELGYICLRLRQPRPVSRKVDRIVPEYQTLKAPAVFTHISQRWRRHDTT